LADHVFEIACSKDEKYIYRGSEALHIGNHGPDYIKYVTNRLITAKRLGGSQADIVKELNDIRAELLSGSLKLN
jgi:hypothetical protein